MIGEDEANGTPARAYEEGGSDFGIFVPMIDSNLPLGKSRVASKEPGRL